MSKQKQAGIILVIFGLMLAVGAGLLASERGKTVPGFSALLPAEKTSFFFKFPKNLAAFPAQEIQKIFGLNWEKDVQPWTDEHAAFALVEGTPILLMNIEKTDLAEEFLRSHKKAKLLGETIIFGEELGSGGARTDLASSPRLAGHPAEAGLRLGLLSNDSNFFKIYRNIAEKEEYFLFIRPLEVPREWYAQISAALPAMPILTLPFPTLGLAFSETDHGFQGSTFALTEGIIPQSQASASPRPYRAKLLPYLPADFDLLLGGENLPVQIEKIDALLGQRMSLPGLQDTLQLLSENTGQADFSSTFLPLVAHEFAFIQKGDRFLLAAEIPDAMPPNGLGSFRAGLSEIAAEAWPLEQKVTLADGTIAAELIPDPESVKRVQDNFDGILVEGLEYGSPLHRKGFFDAYAQGKWFFANDRALLQEALRLTKGPGLSLRESAVYRNSLQPILENPELFGVSILPNGQTMSFSKRMDGEHMESNFKLRSSSL